MSMCVKPDNELDSAAAMKYEDIETEDEDSSDEELETEETIW